MDGQLDTWAKKIMLGAREEEHNFPSPTRCFKTYYASKTRSDKTFVGHN